MPRYLTQAADKKVIRDVRKLGGRATKVLRGSTPGHVLKFLDEEADALGKQLVEPLLGAKAPYVAVAIEKLNRKRLAQYHPDRDGLGIRWRVDVNVVHLGRAKADVVRALLHEIIHAVQNDEGSPGKGKHHNEEFIAWCWWLGIDSDDRGCDGGTYPDSAFAEYCKRRGLGDGRLIEEGREKLPKAKGSPLKKWTCGCGTNVRVATLLDATCNLCETKFELQE